MPLKYQTYILDEKTIDEFSRKLQDYLLNMHMENNSIQRIRLTVEELLLNIHNAAYEQIEIGLGKHFGRYVLNMRYKGDPFDPTKEDEIGLPDFVLNTLGFTPLWNYSRNTNTVSLILVERQKKSVAFLIMTAVVCALLLGLAGNGLPVSFTQSVSDVLLTPLQNGFLSLMKTFSGLMIGFTVCNGILGMEDSLKGKHKGRSMVIRAIGACFMVSACAVIVTLPFLDLQFSQKGQGSLSEISMIIKLLFDIIPPNIIEPFMTGNSLQIVVIASLIGIGLIALKERADHIRTLVSEAAVLMQYVVSLVCSFVPVFIFAVILSQVLSGQMRMLLTVFKPLFLISMVMMIISSAIVMISSVYLKCSPVLLIRKTWQPFFIALTSASSMAAFTSGIEVCEKRLGADRSAVSFMYPLLSILYRPAGIIYYAVLTCCLAEIYQIEISFSWLLMDAILSAIVIISLPPITGSAILGYAILFTSLLIPNEAIALATVINVVADFILTGLNVLLLMIRVACDAKRIDLLDQRVLLSEDK